MKQFLITVAGVFAGLALFMIGVPLLILAVVAGSLRPAPLAPRTVLVLDLRGGLSDQATTSPLALLQGRSLSVMGIEETLRRAARDGRVKGLFVRLPEGGMAPAAADELRLAFLGFRAAGKPILVHSQGLYPGGMVTSTYELAAASGDIWMQPASSFQATGLARQDVFFGGFFKRHGVVADFQQRYEYKTAIDPFLYSDYTAAHRQSELSWLGSVYDTAIADAAADRGKSAAAVRTLIEAGPYPAEDAMAKGLVDHVGQVKAAENDLLAKAGAGARLVEFDDYAARGGGGGEGGPGDPAIAVIAAEGDIMTGRGSGPSPLSAGSTIRSDEVSKAFYDAIDDKSVRAIVFRVSSPGGSDTASEQILAAVRAARAAGKPVVVSMGTYGASGGYWISSQASEIVAEPGTLTGSIGVFGGKFALGPALAKFGVDVRGLSVGGDYAGAFSSEGPMTGAQRAAYSAWMDRIYNGFVGRVAEGRRLPVARVREIARGRVWTGAQAKALGLVDRLGGFYDAAERAKALAGTKGPARLVSFTVRSSPLEALRRMLGAGSQSATIAAAALAVLEDPATRATLADVADARLRAQGATVLASRLAQ
ncbi:MAG: signal peptide peptidase SppA [Caulobacteraceae bacterium]